MSNDQLDGLFVALVCAWWLGYSIGYRCRMHEQLDNYPAWLGIIILLGAILGVVAAFCGLMLIVNASGIIKI